MTCSGTVGGHCTTSTRDWPNGLTFLRLDADKVVAARVALVMGSGLAVLNFLEQHVFD